MANDPNSNNARSSSPAISTTSSSSSALSSLPRTPTPPTEELRLISTLHDAQHEVFCTHTDICDCPMHASWPDGATAEEVKEEVKMFPHWSEWALGAWRFPVSAERESLRLERGKVEREVVALLTGMAGLSLRVGVKGVADVVEGVRKEIAEVEANSNPQHITHNDALTAGIIHEAHIVSTLITNCGADSPLMEKIHNALSTIAQPDKDWNVWDVATQLDRALDGMEAKDHFLAHFWRFAPRTVHRSQRFSAVWASEEERERVEREVEDVLGL
ncbi:hypothetical protein LTR37_017616 [Vermiconidia calcicola]|uniref:Uncharacterized protein n=1 Tax=Vermiconidia calcicola TaxID=1690605 RepID=A0ACC3MM63_9PEZI|nr:hypothetical protein LTR37_017616 [Vermiconidia calcicola]